MKILHLISDSEWGPSSRLGLDLCRELNARGHSAQAIVRNEHAIREPFEAAGVATATAPLRGTFDVVSPVKLSKILRDAPENRTVIHTYRFGDAVTAARARSLASRPDIKIVVTRLLTAPAKTGVTATAIYNEIDALTFPTEYALREFRGSEPEIDKSKLSIIRTAVAVPATVDAPVPVRDPELVNILTAGAIDSDKGLDTLVEALGIISDKPFRATVIGVGHGPVVMPVIRRSRDLGIADRIDWRGNCTDLVSAVREADIAVCPEKKVTLSGVEFPTYIAHGVPTVASDIELNKEVGQNLECVSFFRSGDPESLAATLAELIEKRGEHKGSNPGDFAAYASETEQLYLSLLK